MDRNRLRLPDARGDDVLLITGMETSKSSERSQRRFLAFPVWPRKIYQNAMVPNMPTYYTMKCQCRLFCIVSWYLRIHLRNGFGRRSFENGFVQQEICLGESKRYSGLGQRTLYRYRSYSVLNCAARIYMSCIYMSFNMFAE